MNLNAKMFFCTTSLLCLVGAGWRVVQPNNEEVSLFAKGKISERGTSRIAFWKGREGYGQVVVNYGRPVWNERFEQLFASWIHDRRLMGGPGGYWRIGNNYWTALDSSLVFTAAGIRVSPGYYYLAVSPPEPGVSEWSLLFLDPEQARRELLDPFELATHPDQVKVLHRVPMEYRELGQRIEKLTAEFTPETEAGTSATLAFRFGKWELSVPIVIEIP